MKEIRTIAILMLCCMGIVACRDEVMVVYPTTEESTAVSDDGNMAGLYVLCEGNMGSNKATLDYLDFATSTYQRNIYPSRNPNTPMELGDVGNDIKIYGSQLWMVINCSNKVEVADARTARSITHINIPNCRYMAFHNGYAYISSYVGQMAESQMMGSVYKVDTVSHAIVGQITVGRQPEELAIVGNKLYVANSGGYSGAQGHGYDRKISVIDLSTFSKEAEIDVAPNLHRLRSDSHGQLWVSSRGDNDSFQPKLYVLRENQHGMMEKTDSMSMSVGDMCVVGDSVYFYSTSLGNNGRTSENTYGIINAGTHQIVNNSLVKTNDDKPSPTTPYGMVVHPQTKDIFLMDATNYVSSGRLFHYDCHGELLGVNWTGDIPGHAAFLPKRLTPPPPEKPDDTSDEPHSPWIEAVDEYVPAPGQFVNILPAYEDGDDAKTMAMKCTEAIAHNNGGMVTLGGYGGYITFHFDHSIANIEGENDFLISGNAIKGNSEPGIVMVSQDTNHNNLPDDQWYELSGSCDNDAAQKPVYGYEIEYCKAPMSDIPWTDNQGNNGVVARNSFHQQEYFPMWLPSPLRFKGTRLPDNATDQGTNGTAYWVLSPFAYGYADNLTDDEGSSFNIEWAVDRRRQPVRLTHVDFIRVYTAVNQQCGWIGETSTEITGARDLHFTGSGK